MVKLERVYLMNVILYLDSLNTLRVFLLISKDCNTAFTMLRINPFYSHKTLEQELKLFSHTKHETLCSIYLRNTSYFNIADLLELTINISMFHSLLSQKDLLPKIVSLKVIFSSSQNDVSASRCEHFDIAKFPNLKHLKIYTEATQNKWTINGWVFVCDFTFIDFSNFEKSKLETFHMFCDDPNRFDFTKNGPQVRDTGILLLHKFCSKFSVLENIKFYFVTDLPDDIETLDLKYKNVIFLTTKFMQHKEDDFEIKEDLTKEKMIYTYSCLKRPGHVEEVLKNHEKYYLMELNLKEPNIGGDIDLTQVTSLTALTVFQPCNSVNLKMPSTVEKLEMKVKNECVSKANLEGIKYLDVRGNLVDQLPQKLEFLKTESLRNWSDCIYLKEIVLSDFRNGTIGSYCEIDLPMCTTKLVIEKTSEKYFDLSKCQLELLEIVDSNVDTIRAPKSLKRVVSDNKIKEIIGFNGMVETFNKIVEPLVDENCQEVEDFELQKQQHEKCVLQ
ncbi:hypothetical protein EIN_354930 [Entamoeba invadens IP1]|uniref:Uncharacterized protein n=1 Tax=Entamoeba invadens IP1 TaxID=370355 RepID=L7FKU9_ENTIV|nr:hypothetical protein EIN_354930 [Entamoeba invadens IP1]ELP87171.1 hypothetical protein EIN_354930 [Entamoeba invadens IP1]|eukprot:XP_004253942.1 hypothetical protein EIN_354930 [Entamoeba invadens IP1]